MRCQVIVIGALLFGSVTLVPEIARLADKPGGTFLAFAQEGSKSARKEAMRAKREEKAKALIANPPTEQDLGVAIYPGARLDPQASAGMSLNGDASTWIYLSDDLPGKVSKFYAGKTGLQPVAIEKSFMFALRGAPPFPEHMVLVEPNKMLTGSAKTVITIRRVLPTP